MSAFCFAFWHSVFSKEQHTKSRGNTLDTQNKVEIGYRPFWKTEDLLAIIAQLSRIFLRICAKLRMWTNCPGYAILQRDHKAEGRGTTVPTWEDIFYLFEDTLIAHAALAVYLFAVMGERDWQQLKKLPGLLSSPLLIVLLTPSLSIAFGPSTVTLCISSFAILLMCTLWVRWAWRTGFWRAFAAVCIAGVFQVAASCLSRILFQTPGLAVPAKAVYAIYCAVVLSTAALLYRLRFGYWFRLLLEDNLSQRRTALLLFAMVEFMEVFFLLQKGVRTEYLIPYYLLVLAMTALEAGIVVYLAQRLDAIGKVKAQRDIIAQQQLYEQDLEAIRREVRTFRHDYKNLLAGLSEQASTGELEQLRAALAQLDVDFDQRIGEKIRVSTQIGNLCVPQVRSLLLSKLAGMGKRGIDCRLEVLYPMEQVGMDVWDFIRCLGILLDNAAEAAVETETPWTQIVLLAQGEELSLQVSNPYAGTIDPDRLWTEGYSTKGKGRGLGLSSYQQILARYPNAVCSTSWAGGVFVQRLTIGGRR